MENKKENKLKTWYINFNEKHKGLCEIIRFVIVGGIATVIDYIVMGIVLYLFNPSLYPHFYNVWIGRVGEPSTLATVIGTGMGFCVSLIANYLLSILFVYEEKGNSKTVKGAVLFAILSAIGLLINMVGMWLGFDICGINEWIVKILVTLVVLVYNYLSRKFIIFKDTKNTKNEIIENSNNSEIKTETEVQSTENKTQETENN